MPEPLKRRQVRVFISSTFRDMNSERDHLVTVVFPELRDRVERLGLEFYDVDLRWGVPETNVDGERANSWAYCKRWIDEVEPFFVCMLGQRYGWRPPAAELIDPADRKAYAGMSITEMEIRHALQQPPHLKHTLFYLRRTEVPPSARKYAEFVDAADLDDLAELKGLIPTDRPVREYDCHWTGDGFDELDDFGKMVLEDLWGAVLRDERYVSRETWQRVLGHDPAQDPLYTDPSIAVPETTWEALVEASKPAPQDPLDAEAEQMARFAESRLKWFQGRGKELAELRAFVQDGPPEDASRLCVVRAAAGTGKTALLARMAQDLVGHDCLLLTHFVGASERSADARSLLERLLAEMDRHGVPAPEETEEGAAPALDLNGLSKQLVDRLRDYDREPRLVIVFDALNELTDGHGLSWLPAQLGPNVRIVVSCLADPQAALDSPAARMLRALESRRPGPRWVDLAPLDEADVREIVREYLHEYCHELDREPTDAIAAMPQARNPLYLRVMLDVLRALGGNDMHLQVREIIRNLPAERPDATSLFVWVLERLAPFGEESVRLWCSYLALGRVGMSSRELGDLLARKLGPEAGAAALRIERALRRYLQRRGPQWDFFHGALREAVERHCLSRLDPVELHADIASYLETRWREPDRHALSELPYHQTEGQCWGALDGILTDIGFLEAKCAAQMTYGLVTDYDRAVAARYDGEPGTGLVAELGGFVTVQAHEFVDFAAHPGYVLQAALNYHRSPAVVRAARARWEALRARPPVLVRQPTRTEPVTQAVSATLAGPAAQVAVTPAGDIGFSAGSHRPGDPLGLHVWALPSGVPLDDVGLVPGDLAYDITPTMAHLKQGAPRLAAAGRSVYVAHGGSLFVLGLADPATVAHVPLPSLGVGALRVSRDGRVIAVQTDAGLLLLRDGQDLEVVGTQPMVPMMHLGGWDEPIALSACGRYLVARGRSEWMSAPPGGLNGSAGDLTVWGTDPLVALADFEGREVTTAVAIGTDGVTVYTGDWRGAVRAWNGTGWAWEKAGHDGRIDQLALSDDGAMLATCGPDGVRVWGTDGCELLAELPVRTECLAAAADFSTILAGSQVWQPRFGRARQGPARSRALAAAAWSPEQGLAAAVEHTGAVSLVRLEKGEWYELGRHVLAATTVAFSASGGSVCSGGWDDAVRVWDTATGPVACLRHWGEVKSVCVVPGSGLLAAAVDDGTVWLWDIAREQCVHRLSVPGRSVVAVACQGARLCAAGSQISVWETERWSLDRELGAGCGSFHAVDLSPDARQVAAGVSGGAVWLWDLDADAPPRRLPDPSDRARSVRLLHGGDPASGFAERVRTVRYSRDGRWLVSLSGTVVRVWDVRLGTCQMVWGGDAQCISECDADGRFCVGTQDGLAVWRITTTFDRE